MKEHGTSTTAALEFFDSLPPARLEECYGRWRGTTVPSGHPLDGLLDSLGWYGKEFIDSEQVHPIVFKGRGEKVFPVNPAFLPAEFTFRHSRLAHSNPTRAAFNFVRPILRTSKPKARLRLLECRGVATACMIYDDHPIIDVFRKVDDRTLLGMMEMRGMRDPYFFVLYRD